MELISISDVARRLGVPRPTLSKIIKDHKIQTKKTGRMCLVSLHECQERIQILAAQGKVLTRAGRKKQQNQEDSIQFIIEHMTDEIKKLTRKKDELEDKNEALVSENQALRGEIKRLTAPEEKASTDTNHKNLSWIQKGSAIGKMLFNVT
jgi:excisionase family DNA binding protein